MSPWTKSPARTVIPYQPNFFPRVLGSCMSRIFPATRKMIPKGKYLWEDKQSTSGSGWCGASPYRRFHIFLCFHGGIIDKMFDWHHEERTVPFLSGSGSQGSWFHRERCHSCPTRTLQHSRCYSSAQLSQPTGAADPVSLRPLIL